MTTTFEVLAIATARRACTDGQIRYLRQRFDLSQRELAAALQVSGATLSRWENGRERPTGVRALRLARMLHELLEVAAAS